MDNEAFNRSFRVPADDAAQNEIGSCGGIIHEHFNYIWQSVWHIHGQQLAELRDNMGRFSLEFADDMLTLSFSDFAPIDIKDTNGVRRTGLPGELSAERIAESAQGLDFLADWFRAFV